MSTKRALCAVLLLMFLPMAVWIALDQHCWEWDQARYAHMSFDLWQFHRSDPALWWWTSFHHLPNKAPGVSWVGQWFVYLKPLVGSVEHALMIQPFACTLISCMLLRGVASRLAPGQLLVAWVGGVLLLSSPLFMGLHVEYMTEPLQMLGICWVLWLLVVKSELSLVAVFSHGCGALALCMMSKGVTAMYIWGFGLLILWHAGQRLFRFRQEEWKLPVRSWFGCGLSVLMLGAACLWYLNNLKHVLGYVTSASRGGVALAYGVERSYSEKVMVWLGYLAQSFTTPLLVGVLVVVLVSAFVRKQKNKKVALGPLELVSLAQIGLVWMVVTRSTTEEWRPLLGMVPSFFVLLIWLFRRSGSRWVQAAVLVTLLAQWGAIQCTFFGLEEPKLLSVAQPLRTLERSPAQRNELYRLIEVTTQQCPQEEQAMMCAVSMPWLNANTLKFYAAITDLDTPRYGFYGSTGFITTDLSVLIRKFEMEEPCVVITMDADAQSDYSFESTASVAFSTFIRENEHFTQLPFESAYGVQLYGRK